MDIKIPSAVRSFFFLPFGLQKEEGGGDLTIPNVGFFFFFLFFFKNKIDGQRGRET